MLGRPALAPLSAARAGRQDDDGRSSWVETAQHLLGNPPFLRAFRQDHLNRVAPGADRLGEEQVALDAIQATTPRTHPIIGQCETELPAVTRRESDTTGRRREQRQKAALEAPLKVQDHAEAPPAQVARECGDEPGQEARSGRGIAKLTARELKDLVDLRVAAQEIVG